MKRIIVSILTILSVFLFSNSILAGKQTGGKTNRLEKVFSAFWKGNSEKARKRSVKKILKMNPAFDNVWGLLKKGKKYSAHVKKGRQTGMRMGKNSLKHYYSFHVPESYDPSVSYPVIFYLHGGVNRPPFKPDARWWNWEEQTWRKDRISVFPASWKESLWWEFSQVENIKTILDRIRNQYNVDTNRVFISGISDGGTGAYYQALFNATPWAGVMSYIGHLGVLTNPANGVEGHMFPVNLTNKPLLVINCGHDRLYPLRIIEPFVDLLQKAGADVILKRKPFYGHTVRWFPEEAKVVDAFIETKRRNPYPDKLVWETDDLKTSNRVHWLIIETLGTVPGESEMDEHNRVKMGTYLPAMGLEFDLKSKDRLVIFRVIDGLIAQAAGLKPGDTILQANGQDVTDKEEFQRIIKPFSFGMTIPLRVMRSDKQYNAELILPKAGKKRTFRVFPRKGPSGRVELKKVGNHVSVRTKGVKAFSLLLSPEHFDFGRSIEVTINGITAFKEMPVKDVKTLTKWAARDADRAMLFAAQIGFTLPLSQ